MKKSLNIITFLMVFSMGAFAQKDIVNEEINITKDKQIDVQKADKIVDKIPPLKTDTKEKKMLYSFSDRKPTGVELVKFNPSVVSPISSKKNDLIDENYNNYVKIGVGNFGRIYAETDINSSQDRSLIWGIYALHNSTKRGPVANANSGTMKDKIKLDGKYILTNNELKMNVGFERRNYYFYGYDPTTQPDYSRSDIRQTLNLFSIGASFENTNPSPMVDYKVSTSLNTLNDYYSASEIDWGTKLHSYFPIMPEKLFALLDAEAYLTQRTDNYEVNPTRKRNLFRVEPSFRLDLGRFSAKLGFKAVNEYDQILQINSTKGYPVASLSYKTDALIYFFAGFDADIIRNTLHSFYDQNPFLVEQVNLQNTYKNQDFYIGNRADFDGGFSYNAKVSYGQYTNLNYFVQYNGSTLSKAGVPVSVTKFQAEYDDGKIQFANPSVEVGYSNFEWWKTNLKLDYYYYQSKKFAKPYGRPNFVGKWGNTFVVTDKLVANLDFYYLAGLYAKDANLVDPVKMKNVADLNAEITYLFSKQFSTFVKLNNILGKNYQIYYNYPQLGLNFMVGVNLTF